MNIKGNAIWQSAALTKNTPSTTSTRFLLWGEHGCLVMITRKDILMRVT